MVNGNMVWEKNVCAIYRASKLVCLRACPLERNRTGHIDKPDDSVVTKFRKFNSFETSFLHCVYVLIMI